MHTGRSMDSETPPEVAVRWYAERGFDFIVITDHNAVTRVDGQGGMLVLPGIELTQNYRTCDPPPPEGMACLLHVTGLFVDGRMDQIAFPPPASLDRAALFERAVHETLAAGGIAMLNHPNFHDAASTDLLVELAAHGVTLLEVRNEAVDSHNEGDATHPSTEAMWDAALTRGARVFGTATDDAHHYDDAGAVRALGRTAYTGDRGFVMVRADKTPTAIRAAVERGDFYGSTGVVLDEVAMEPKAIHVHATKDVSFDVIGTGGVVLSTTEGRVVDFDPAKAPRGYVRVRAHDVAGRVAFTEPLFLP